MRASACMQVELSVPIRGAVAANGKLCGVSCFRKYSWHWSVAFRTGIHAASVARDTRRLTDKWWAASRPNKAGAPSPVLDGERGFQFLLHRWLKERGLFEYLRRVEDQEGWRCYACAKTPPTNEEKNWTVAYHGTRWYALWLLLSTGALL